MLIASHSGCRSVREQVIRRLPLRQSSSSDPSVADELSRRADLAADLAGRCRSSGMRDRRCDRRSRCGLRCGKNPESCRRGPAGTTPMIGRLVNGRGSSILRRRGCRDFRRCERRETVNVRNGPPPPQTAQASRVCETSHHCYQRPRRLGALAFDEYTPPSIFSLPRS